MGTVLLQRASTGEEARGSNGDVGERPLGQDVCGTVSCHLPGFLFTLMILHAGVEPQKAQNCQGDTVGFLSQLVYLLICKKTTTNAHVWETNNRIRKGNILTKFGEKIHFAL